MTRPRRSRLRGFARVGVIIVGAVFALVFTRVAIRVFTRSAQK